MKLILLEVNLLLRPLLSRFNRRTKPILPGVSPVTGANIVAALRRMDGEKKDLLAIKINHLPPVSQKFVGFAFDNRPQEGAAGSTPESESR